MRKLKLQELGRLSAEEFQQTEKTPVVVVLDSVRSLHNVGSAFRTSDAFAVEKLLLCGITGTPPDKEIRKTALGAEDTVAWEHQKDAHEAVKKLKEDGYWVICVEQAEGSTELQHFQPQPGQKYALVFGNEVFGVSEEVMELADGCLEIPQFGTKHSLNVSVAMGVVLWEVVRKIRI
ncbi:MAG: TrmH family RNA methyltransferase [Chitinophagaceae bacterium]|nr:MAG: TrmH family RNA methyltransferase [Chitinophagaceae bacterium]